MLHEKPHASFLLEIARASGNGKTAPGNEERAPHASFLLERAPSILRAPTTSSTTWNAQPSDIVSSRTVNTFKNRLDQHWELNPQVCQPSSNYDLHYQM